MRYLLFLFLFSTAIWSCIPYKDIVGFQGIHNIQFDTAQVIKNMHDVHIQADNLINIQVQSLDPDITKAFNIVAENPYMFNNPQTIENFVGYYVDSDGFIDFPVVGRVKLGGLTITEAKNLLTEKMSAYLKGAVINMRFINSKVTVLGEVRKPGVVKFSNKRLTVLEALGEAGDFTEYAKRDTILIIREVNGKRTTARLNLQDKSFLNSDFYYLDQNDVVYIEPTIHKAPSLRDKSDKILPIGSAIASVLISIVSLVISARKP